MFGFFGPEAAQQPMPSAEHTRLMARGSRARDTALPELCPPKMAQGQAVNVTKPTDSPGGDPEPASAHPSLGKQNALEDYRKIWAWMEMAPAQEWICDKLYSPALSWKEHARAGRVGAGSLCPALLREV